MEVRTDIFFVLMSNNSQFISCWGLQITEQSFIDHVLWFNCPVICLRYIDWKACVGWMFLQIITHVIWSIKELM